MKISVLQGLNSKNPITTVVAELKAVKPELLDFIKELHPVFMKDYCIVDEKTLEVQTHLPHLWKNQRFLAPIEAFSMGECDFDTAQTHLLEVIKLLINSMSTIPILHAAHQRGYETLQLYTNEGIIGKDLLNRYYNIGIGKETTVTVSASSVGDSVLAYKTQRDKWFTNQYIEAMGLPMAPWAHVVSREELPAVAEKIGFPLVIKPVGLTGGHGVFVGLDTVEELQECYDKIKEIFIEKPTLSGWQGEIIVQKKIEGLDYRVLVVNGKMEIATNRIPAQVTGDGTHTIRQLIEIENKNPARNTMLPTHTLKPIVIDQELETIVHKNNHTLDGILPKCETVQVRKVASMSQGGITKDVTDIIHPQTRLICETIGASIFANVLGVDVLCKDITKPLTPDNGSIIEMNTMPESYLNAFPVIGPQYPDIGEKILRALIPDDVHTKTIVAIGEFKNDVLTKLIQDQFGHLNKIGTFCDGTMLINGYPINTKIQTPIGILSLKKNKTLDAITLVYKTASEIEEYGFGFDRIDLLITGKDALGPLDRIIDEYRKKELIHKLIQA